MSVNTLGNLLVGGVSFDKERVSWWRVEPQSIECEQCPSLLEEDLGAHIPSAVDLAAAFADDIPLPSAVVAALQLDVSCCAIIMVSVPAAARSLDANSNTCRRPCDAGDRAEWLLLLVAMWNGV
jgi:hypothetical protein